MPDPTRTAIGTWSGGRFMHFGEPLDDDRLAALLRPDERIRTVMTADAYGAGEADSLLGRALSGCRPRRLLPGRRRRPRLLRGRARRREGLPALHRRAPARRGAVCVLPAHGRRALARADRRRRVRPAAPAQPGPDRLHQPGGVGGDGGAARCRAHAAARHRPRPGQRLHARPARLLRAVRRAARLGDDHLRTRSSRGRASSCSTPRAITTSR